MIVKDDFNTHMYAELIDLIQRNDDSILMDAINAAEGEAKGYLASYDTDTLFGQNGNDRDPTLFMYVKDMAAWHFINLCNAGVDLELRKTRYDDAKSWLKDVQKGNVFMKEWPTPNPGEPKDSTPLKVSSRPKRPTNY